MGFASAYLEERAIFPELIKEAPHKDTGIIVVVPAYDEPGIIKMLGSLILCNIPPCRIELIVIVNAPENASPVSIRNNDLTIDYIETWKRKNADSFFRVYFVNTGNGNIRRWGVGLARKTGMDEAVRRFNNLGKPEGVILNLDADCLVDRNYFTAVYNELLIKKDRSACSVYFEHPLDGTDYPAEVYRYITLYELHLRYYFQALAYAGYPFVYHTVGSAIGVKALQYVKAGGMNRRQAGEDFYFIQKLVPAGGYFSLNSTTVYPSPRPSFRVPFGTGASIAKMTESGEESFLSYDLAAFSELRVFFSMAGDFYQMKCEGPGDLYEMLPVGLKSFLTGQELCDKMSEIRNNTSGYMAFKKRFFSWFNMFRIVKYLNYVHSGIYKREPVTFCASELLKAREIFINPENLMELIRYYRSLEKES